MQANKQPTKDTLSGELHFRKTLEEMICHDGNKFSDLQEKKSCLLVFLRHFGCVFCREALDEINKVKDHFEDNNVNIVLVHMSTPEAASEYFKKYNLQNHLHISDTACQYYKSFGLIKGNFNQLFGLQTWIRGFNAGLIKGYGVGGLMGDGFQMPGVFLIKDYKVLHSFIHKVASDRPNYKKFIKVAIKSTKS